MTDRDRFLSAIAADPDNDTPRLAYADFLDEQDPVTITCPECHGEGEIWTGFEKKGGPYEGPRPEYVIAPPTGRHRVPCPVCRGEHTVVDYDDRVRAELIRVQVEIGARRRAFNEKRAECFHPDTAGRVFRDPANCDCPDCILETRSRRIQRAHATRWLVCGPCPRCVVGDGQLNTTCPTCLGTGDVGRLTGFRFAVEYHRGFVERITCNMNDSGVFVHNRVRLALNHSHVCAWVRTFPILREIVPSDRSPAHVENAPETIGPAVSAPGGLWLFNCVAETDPDFWTLKHRIPYWIIERMVADGRDVVSWTRVGESFVVYFKDSVTAFASIGRAVLAHVRALLQESEPKGMLVP